MPADTKPLPEPVLNQLYITIWRHKRRQWSNGENHSQIANKQYVLSRKGGDYNA